MTLKTSDLIKKDVASFIEKTFLYVIGEEGIDGDTNLFEAGVMDSYGLVELVSFLETKFGIAIEDEEMMTPELTTYDGTIQLVERKLNVKN